MCLVLAERLAAQEVGSLKILDLDKTGKRFTVDVLVDENHALKKRLFSVEAALITLQKNFGTVTSEAESFRRKAAELTVRLEALGTEEVDGRLVKLLNELKLAGEERTKVRDSLVELTEAAVRYGKSSIGTDPLARLELEATLREAGKVLGLATRQVVDPQAIPANLADGMVVSVKDDLSLIVTNIGAIQGVRLGMPFEVIRNQAVIGSVRVVDVRDKIAGALIQNLSDKKVMKVGDRLKVVARQ